jgi:holo-[acyl-carrier protein] synthase
MSPAEPPIRHGVDLVEIPRLRALMARHAAFETRVFTPAERAYCRRYPDPLPHYAARFAAKEAALKTLGLGLSPLGIDRTLQDIEVVREGTAPTLALRGRPARRAARLGLGPAALSLTHTDSYALASIVMPAHPGDRS